MKQIFISVVLVVSNVIFVGKYCAVFNFFINAKMYSQNSLSKKG